MKRYSSAVLRLRAIDRMDLGLLLERYGLTLRMVSLGESVPASYWGESEAGLRGSQLFARPDTPIHSILHETSHYACMTPERRALLDIDAGGDDLEESAVCYLQIALADELPQMGRERMIADMDAWGYSFRLGSTRAWLDADADDARQWLLRHGLIDSAGRASGCLRV
ncbi:MAG: hypothetical protein R3E77_13260 [Steroidobacteraceae bacterium]